MRGPSIVIAITLVLSEDSSANARFHLRRVEDFDTVITENAASSASLPSFDIFGTLGDARSLVAAHHVRRVHNTTSMTASIGPINTLHSNSSIVVTSEDPAKVNTGLDVPELTFQSNAAISDVPVSSIFDEGCEVSSVQLPIIEVEILGELGRGSNIYTRASLLHEEVVTTGEMSETPDLYQILHTGYGAKASRQGNHGQPAQLHHPRFFGNPRTRWVGINRLPLYPLRMQRKSQLMNQIYSR
ncbi:unnamed protein product [Phytophthora fragariaefolia]|uniref:Unnamed protein product n=1 Tax=Phytophthora fragariaefolia TaxID=1490495 RepID=A0A9W7CLD4_9STRA|nr:unnamed protein product [Phytophthora fragariaefolia]